MNPLKSNGEMIEDVVQFRRRAVTLGSVVREGPYSAELNLPWLIQSVTDGVDAIQWALNNKERLESMLCHHGAILFRGFSLKGVEDFRRFVDATSSGLVKYTYRASPRQEVSDSVYTSTEYPADQSIFPHNEHAFSPVFPRKLFFYCETPSQTGGETPIGNGRRIRDAIPAATRQKFREKGVMYLRNYGINMGLPWQTVFQTEDPAEVEKYCREHNISWRWKPNGKLSTQQVGPAFIRHPHTGEELWFNHATFFHVTTLSTAIRDALCSSFEESDLPNNTYYGDGSAIEQEVLEGLRAAYLGQMVKFPWQRGDLLMVDNMLVVHGRSPFQGFRRILVGMAEPTDAQSVKIN